MLRFLAAVSLSFLFFSCVTRPVVSTNEKAAASEKIPAEDLTNIDITSADTANAEIELKDKHIDDILAALTNAHIPSEIINDILADMGAENNFTDDLNIILKTNPAFWILVDKEHSLGSNYTPQDLVLLTRGSFVLNRDGLYLQKDAAASLEEMSAAAKKAGLTLAVSSAYRSYSYQGEVYSRNVNQMGRQAADRVSARPGHSQHQLGLVVDFGSITNAFAATREGRWLAANASDFGWSLSYPQNMEQITGYSWESWHYRYVGMETAAFIDKYFEGIQQYALRFLREYEKSIEQ